MSRWFRLDDDVINDPKILLLPEAMRWIWVAFLCIASKNNGVLPTIEIIALSLRVKTVKAAEYLTRLVGAGLIDKTETGFEPHNWNKRQFKSDVSTERVKRFRKQPRNVSETPPHTQTETQSQNSDADASGGEPPIDHRKRLFNEGLQKLAAMTGKGPDACRSFVGKCLKAASDDAIVVLGLIEDAERNQTVDPTAWIAARLKPRENSNGRRTVQDAARDLHEQTIAAVLAFDEPAPGGIRDGTGAPAVRLLPPR